MKESDHLIINTFTEVFFMSKRNILIGVSVVVLAIGWYAFRPELIFINKTVNEEFPG